MRALKLRSSNAFSRGCEVALSLHLKHENPISLKVVPRVRLVQNNQAHVKA